MSITEEKVVAAISGNALSVRQITEKLGIRPEEAGFTLLDILDDLRRKGLVEIAIDRSKEFGPDTYRHYLISEVQKLEKSGILSRTKEILEGKSLLEEAKELFTKERWWP